MNRAHKEMPGSRTTQAGGTSAICTLGRQYTLPHTQHLEAVLARCQLEVELAEGARAVRAVLYQQPRPPRAALAAGWVLQVHVGVLADSPLRVQRVRKLEVLQQLLLTSGRAFQIQIMVIQEAQYPYALLQDRSCASVQTQLAGLYCSRPS